MPSPIDKRVNVLLVEDSEDDARLALRALRRGGFEAHYERVQSAAAMQAALARQAWDAVISDFNMPGFTGLDALGILKSNGLDIPFILVSGAVGEDLAVDAMKAGASDYLMKQNLARLAPALKRELAETAIRASHRRAQRELVDSEQRYRRLVHALPAAVYTCDAQGRIMLYNEAAVALWGREPEFGRDRWCGSWKVYEPDGRPMALDDCPMALAITQRAAVLGREIMIERPDGSRRNVLPHPQPMFDASGAMTGAVNMLVDITDRKEAETRIRRLNRVYALLSGINALIVRVRDRDELFRDACRVAAEDGGFRMAWIGIPDREAMQVQPIAWHGTDPEYIGAMPLGLDAARPEQYGLAGRAVTERKAMVTGDMSQDARVLLRQEAQRRSFRSLTILPILLGGEAVAVIALYADEAEFFDEQEMKLLHELTGDLAFALEHLEKGARLDYLAYYDSLTGFANATLFQERLGQIVHLSKQGKLKLALALMNVERFKVVNDSLGRQAGDDLLRQLARRLGSAADPAHVARVGGDHFAVVVPQVEGASDAARTVEQIWRECFARPFSINGTELRVSARVGIAISPADGADAETLFANAEAALKKAKETGERQQFHSPDLTVGTAKALTLENQLRQALDRNEFVLHYQPKVEFDERRIVGVEALIRWQSPELGLVPPGQFIPLLEETGLIVEVGAWALAQAVADHARWLGMGIPAPRVAVNVSAIQLRRRDFSAALEAALKRGAATPGIDLEITESLIMQDIQGNIEKLKAARGLGVRIAIDDFGTGYSSLGYLAKLPVHTLKIDRSFVITMLDDPDTMTLVSTIISLAHTLRLKVVAEGVDAEEQAKMLRLLRCDEMQGYLFSRPLPFEQMTALWT